MDLLQEGIRRGQTRLTESKAPKGLIDPPKTRDELWKFVRDTWGIRIPRVTVCADHCSPFDAFADAFFAQTEHGTPVPMSVWHASRGFGGKSALLALLAQTEAATLGAKVNLLGGSGEQSERVLKYMYGEEIPNTFWEHPNAPVHLIQGGLEHGALKKETVLLNGGYIRALMASSRSVRGPHPERLRLDEVDEMELDIFDSSMGQTMALRNIPAQTVASSTWHYSDGTMTEILKRAKEKGWPVYRWCMHENHEDYGGWLPQSEIDRKKNETTTVMFDVEYELQEPSPESRAIAPEAVAAMFRESLGKFIGKRDEVIKIPHIVYPRHQMVFATGADWAKRKDSTVISTLQEIPNTKEEISEIYRTEGRKAKLPLKARLVEFVRTNRKPWPVMVGAMEKRCKIYRKLGESISAHDQTGIGDVIQDYMNDEGETEGLWLTGQLRYTIFNDWITAIEHGWIESPEIDYMHSEYKFVSVDDLTGAGHPPDTFIAGAMAYYILKNKPRRRARATWGS